SSFSRFTAPRRCSPTPRRAQRPLPGPSPRWTSPAARSTCVFLMRRGIRGNRWCAWPPASGCGTRPPAAISSRVRSPARPSPAAECTGRYVGRLQPYAVYVPAKPVPPNGLGLVVSMHGLSANYNEFLGSHEAQEMGDRGSGSILASPESRGPDGSYKSYAEADVFEMWADIARHYRLNPDLTDITGYSMGGGGTYRLASRWPDLWARAFPIVGPPTSAAS